MNTISSPIIVQLIKSLSMVIILLCVKKNESSHKSHKFKVGGRVRITKYKNIFSKGYTKNWSN